MDAYSDLGSHSVDETTSAKVREALRTTDYRDDADERFVRWVRLGCPECGALVDVLDIPQVVAWCGSCPSRPRLEKSAP